MTTVPEEIIPVLIVLRRLLIVYEGARRNEEKLIHLIGEEIEQISQEAKGNFFVETLLFEHNYPRKFTEEDENFENNYEPDTFYLNQD